MIWQGWHSDPSIAQYGFGSSAWLYLVGPLIGGLIAGVIFNRRSQVLDEMEDSEQGEEERVCCNHKGNNNLLVRCFGAFGQASVTAVLIIYEVDIPHKLPLMIC